MSVQDEIAKAEMDMEEPFKELAPIGGTKMAPAVGIAAVALNMAMKYHDISTIKDGALYQQFKLEGRNIPNLHLDMVFETAIKIEAFLLGASERIAKLVVEAIQMVDDETGEPLPSGEEPKPEDLNDTQA